MAPFLEVIQGGMEEEIIKKIELEELIFFLYGGLTGFLRWVFDKKIELTQEKINNHVTIAWDAIKK